MATQTSRPTRRRLLYGATLAAGLVAVNLYLRIGSSAADVLPTAEVRGVVTYRGQPVNGGLVRFTSADPANKVGQASGMLDRDGTFQFHGAPLGPVRVLIDTSNRPAEDYAPWRPDSGRPKPVFIPARFADPKRSGLDREVAAGENVFEFHLD
ncbi:MAG: carboxypeptidase regulatory-like protein [Gemmataceae bacterium]|nr:carboxypeptidase regulatory-like protein [Gemmataceae bacterium]